MIVSSNSTNYQAQLNLPKKSNFKEEKAESSFDSNNSLNLKVAGVHMSISQKALELYAKYIEEVERPLARF